MRQLTYTMLGSFSWAIFAAIAVLGVYSIGPQLETRFNPVYSKFTVQDIRPFEGGLDVQFVYTKYRDCEPMQVTWYTGDIGGLIKAIDSETLRRNPATGPKPLGRQVSYYYRLRGITQLELGSIVQANIYSKCHALWLTKSIIYP